MKNVYEVLWQKEVERDRVRAEIAALRQVIPLLTDTGDAPQLAPSPITLSSQNKWPLSIEEQRSGQARR